MIQEKLIVCVAGVDLDHMFLYPDKTLLMYYVTTPDSYRPDMVKTLLKKIYWRHLTI